MRDRSILAGLLKCTAGSPAINCPVLRYFSGIISGSRREVRDTARPFRKAAGFLPRVCGIRTIVVKEALKEGADMTPSLPQRGRQPKEAGPPLTPRTIFA